MHYGTLSGSFPSNFPNDRDGQWRPVDVTVWVSTNCLSTLIRMCPHCINRYFPSSKQLVPQFTDGFLMYVRYIDIVAFYSEDHSLLICSSICYMFGCLTCSLEITNRMQQCFNIMCILVFTKCFLFLYHFVFCRNTTNFYIMGLLLLDILGASINRETAFTYFTDIMYCVSRRWSKRMR